MDGLLTRVARDQSSGMASIGRLSHEIHASGSLDARLDKAGYHRQAARENLARAATVRQAESALIESPAHARNLFATDVTNVGIGVVRGRFSACDELYITQIFAQPAVYAPPAAIHESFLSQIAAGRRQRGIRPLRLDPILEAMASHSLEAISFPFDRDAFHAVLAGAMSDLKSKDFQALSRVTVDVQFIRDAKDVRVPDSLNRDGARVLGVGVRESEDRQHRPVVIMLSFIGSAD